jgi:hypothetical protein
VADRCLLQTAFFAQVVRESWRGGFERKGLALTMRLDAAPQRQFEHLPDRASRHLGDLGACIGGFAGLPVERLPVHSKSLHVRQRGSTVKCSP